MSVPLLFPAAAAMVLHAPTAPLRSLHVQMMNSYVGPSENDACYLFETREGTKYVCTARPDELAFMMGLDEKDLVEGVKPDDLSLIECAETWSHNGTPQWACTVAEKPGSEVDLDAIKWQDRTWAKRDANMPLTDDGACFIISEEECPDPNKQWYFCSDPSDDDGMVCELVPEWMGSAPDGGHAVWLCSREKPK